MAENVKYYINGEERSSITLDESTEANSVDVQVLDADDPAPTDFIFKQFVKLTSEDKWTDEVKNAVDENGSIAFLPFKDTGTGKNQIYAQGSYYGGGLDSSDVDQTKAYFKDQNGTTQILTVDANGKLCFETYKAITVSSTGGATYEYDSKPTGGTVSLVATFSKEFTSSGWTGTGISANSKVGFKYNATGTYQSNTPVTWSVSGTEVQGDPTNESTKKTVTSSQAISWNYKGYGYFWANSNSILVSDIMPANSGLSITINKGTISTISYSGANTTGNGTVPSTCTKPNTGATTPYLYIFVKGSLADSSFSYKVNGGLAASASKKVGEFTAYSNDVPYSLFVFMDPLDTTSNATLVKA